MAGSGEKKTKKVVRPKKPLNERHIMGFLFGVCVTLTGVLGLLLFVLDQLHIPDIRNVSHYHPLESTIIYDGNGVVVDLVSQENRIVVPLSRMHPLLPKAFVAAEDSRFFEHPGLDSFSVLRAFVNNVRDGRKSQGGSTITQQVAKGLLLSPEKTYLRKFKEAILAWRIDSLLSKDEIIYIYLNQIYLGEGAYGVEAASLTYFGKHASNLSVGEIAILAGLPQAPSRYSPIKHWQNAQGRQRYVLNRMAADGYITLDQARTAFTEHPSLQSSRFQSDPVNGYYLQEVKRRAEQMLGAPLESAGVRIYSNLDQHIQRAAARTVRNGIKAISRRRQQAGVQQKEVGDPEAAIICLDGCSGRVRAITGGTDFLKTPFNRAVQARRPAGSVFKPLVYSGAFERGFGAATVVVDEPLSIPGSDGKPWRPKNFSGRYHGRTSIAQALVHSYNIPAIKVLKRIGVKSVHTLARQAGISSTLPPDLSLALGAVDVSLLEMSGAYIPFTCQGMYHQPTLINRIVTSEGEEIYRHRPRSQRVMSENSANEMKKLLTRVISEGTGKKAGGLAGNTGGKTGTSDENRDAWFIGFHNTSISGVWVGHDQNQSLGSKENGGSTAAPMWRSFMKDIQPK